MIQVREKAHLPRKEIITHRTLMQTTQKAQKQMTNRLKSRAEDIRKKPEQSQTVQTHQIDMKSHATMKKNNMD